MSPPTTPREGNDSPLDMPPQISTKDAFSRQETPSPLSSGEEDVVDSDKTTGKERPLPPGSPIAESSDNADGKPSPNFFAPPVAELNAAGGKPPFSKFSTRTAGLGSSADGKPDPFAQSAVKSDITPGLVASLAPKPTATNTNTSIPFGKGLKAYETTEQHVLVGTQPKQQERKKEFYRSPFDSDNEEDDDKEEAEESFKKSKSIGTDLAKISGLLQQWFAEKETVSKSIKGNHAEGDYIYAINTYMEIIENARTSKMRRGIFGWIENTQ